MRAVIQRVTEASVSVDEQVVGEIGPGLLVLLGVGPGDTEREVQWMAKKVSGLRIFQDASGRMNDSALDLIWAFWSCRSSHCTETVVRESVPILWAQRPQRWRSRFMNHFVKR